MKTDARWQSENRLPLEENQIDWSCKSLRSVECSGSTETVERVLCLCSPYPANKNETLITYDRFSSASKGPCYYFSPFTPAILPIIWRHDRTRIARAIAAREYQGEMFFNFVNSQWNWVAIYLCVTLTRMMLLILFAIRAPIKSVQSIRPFGIFPNRGTNRQMLTLMKH